MKKNILNVLLIFILSVVSSVSNAERVKDLTRIAGLRSNQLIGYGLVVGLNGTGDQTTQTPFTIQSMRNMLSQFGITMPPDEVPQVKNIAAVAVHADLPAFAKIGQTIDVTVSSMGNAKSLRGGTLLMTPLKAIDGKVYAISQGNLVVGGLSASGGDGSKITVNVPSVGRIPNGASIERMVPNAFALGDSLVLNLNRPDFTTATRLAVSINAALGEGTAKSIDAASVRLNLPRDIGQRVAFTSFVENITLTPGDSAARVIVNSRTGTVVISSYVRVSPVAIAHGSMTVTVSENPTVSQPGAFSSGTTELVPDSELTVAEGGSRMFLFDPGVSLNDIVQAVNQVGAAPSDLVAILEALKQAGALHAELIIL
ncbi:MAG: flagellar basal body P-ring protein FlgI [Gammaproteobacteria bacterium]|nr:flagellar basal body P-ring protein FlgI [Gammaproteobacteria bacterium]